MAGLMDFLNSDEARMGIGLLAAGAPQTDPTKTGFGYALQSAQTGVDAWKKQQAATALAQSQMLENMSQAQERQSKAGLAARQNAFLQNPMKADGTFDVQGAVQVGLKPEDIGKYAELRNANRDKAKSSVEGTDEKGQVGTWQTDDYGTRIPGSFIPKFVAPVMVNMGGRGMGAVDPVSGLIKNTYEVTPDANAVLASNTSTRNADQATATTVWSKQFEQAAKEDAAKNGPLNDVQSKSLNFGARMGQANTILDDLEGKGIVKSFPGGAKGWGVGATINKLQSAELQQLDQAKLNFLYATLRRESGAAISPGEIANAEKQYFPQLGDGPELIEQKRQNRLLATETIKAEVPNYDARMQSINERIAAIPKVTQGSAKAQPSAQPAIAQLPNTPGATTPMPKTFTVKGQQVQAAKAPDGKWYTQGPNGWIPVIPD